MREEENDPNDEGEEEDNRKCKRSNTASMVGPLSNTSVLTS